MRAGVDFSLTGTGGTGRESVSLEKIWGSIFSAYLQKSFPKLDYGKAVILVSNPATRQAVSPGIED
jgi:hypothetical protein